MSPSTQIGILPPISAAQLATAIQVLNHWGVSSDAHLTILGLQECIKQRQLSSYTSGMKPIPESPDSVQRVDHVLGIDTALQTSYPSQSGAGVAWMQQRNSKLRGRTAIQCILQDGCKGLAKIRTLLDCAWAWHQDDQLNPIWETKVHKKGA